MKLAYDTDTDSLSIEFVEPPSEGSTEIAAGVVVDFDDQGRVVGIDPNRQRAEETRSRPRHRQQHAGSDRRHTGRLRSQAHGAPVMKTPQEILAKVLPVWDMDRLRQSPATQPAAEASVQGVQAIWIDAIPFRGRPTKGVRLSGDVRQVGRCG